MRRDRPGLVPQEAGPSVIAVAPAPLAEAAPTYADRLRAVVELARDVAAGRKNGALMSVLVSDARRLLDGRLATLWLVIGSDLVLLAWSGEGPVPAQLAVPGRLDALVATVGRAVRRAEPPPATAATGAVEPGPVPAGYLGVHLGAPERPVGVLVVHVATPRRFTDDDVTLLEGLAALAQVALEPGRAEPPARGAGAPGPPSPVVLPMDAGVGAAASAPVLLVEDDPLVGDLLARFLALDGYRVDRASTGREALERIRARRYGLVVSDIAMPDLDGRAFYRELDRLDPSLARRTVFVTGDIGNPETSRFLEESGVPRLLKPFGLAEFQALIRGVPADG